MQHCFFDVTLKFTVLQRHFHKFCDTPSNLLSNALFRFSLAQIHSSRDTYLIWRFSKVMFVITKTLLGNFWPLAISAIWPFDNFWPLEATILTLTKKWPK